MSRLPITGFGLTGFRSFPNDPQLLGPFKKINIFIGENNSGKSNVLRYLRHVYKPVIDGEGQMKLDNAIDQPRSGPKVSVVPVMLPITDETLTEHFPKLKGDPNGLAEARNVFGAIENPKGYIWLDYRIDQGKVVIDENTSLVNSIEPRLLNNTWIRMTNQTGGSKTHWIQEIFVQYYRATVNKFPAVFIPTLRRIPSMLPSFEDEYGPPVEKNELVEKLSTYAYPEHTNTGDRKRFDSIQNFIRGVLKRPDLRISIPHNKTTINIEDYGRTLPIESLGTGIHQLVVIAIEAILVSDSVVCIEEPELHLHPELQHQLMHFLQNETSNQYFITTHSAVIMDSVDADVYSVRLEDGLTRVERVVGRACRRQICHNMGYRPSDILQANSIVWVEGPSDRIYLKKWLQTKAPDLSEGWHYSIMFYGGRLRSHITVADELADELINLLPINRFTTILIDSDRRAKGSRLDATKKRLIEEFKNTNAFAWVTAGREIENYIARDIRLDAIQGLKGDQCKLVDADDKHGHPLAFKRNGKEEKFDKIAIARSICENDLSFNVLDLEQKLNDLIKYIKHANRMD